METPTNLSRKAYRASYALDIIRVFLGILLFFRAILFLADQTSLMGMLESNGSSFVSTIAAPYIILAHMAGGAMLVLGLMTRIAAAIQIPVLVGAVFFVNVRAGISSVNTGLELSVLVLFLLVIFAIFGSGRFSVDYYLRERQERAMNNFS